MKGLDLENELYWGFMLVSVTAYSAALLALPSGNFNANSENRETRARITPAPKIPIHQTPHRKIRTPKIPIQRTPRG